MSADKYPCIFSRQMAAVVYILYCIAYSARQSKSPTVSKNRQIRAKVVSWCLYGRWWLWVMGSFLLRMYELWSKCPKLSRESSKTRKWIIPSDSECCVQAHAKIYNVNVYLYTAHDMLLTAHITSCLLAVYNSIEWDRTSACDRACEGASGCRYQSIFDLTHPPNN